MDHLYFIVIIACLLLVVGWYFDVEAHGGDASHGLLGIKPDPAPEGADKTPVAERGRRFRVKPIRGAAAQIAAAIALVPPKAAERPTARPVVRTPAYRSRDEARGFSERAARRYKPRELPPDDESA